MLRGNNGLLTWRQVARARMHYNAVFQNLPAQGTHIPGGCVDFSQSQVRTKAPLSAGSAAAQVKSCQNLFVQLSLIMSMT